jgi:hypothetical protein
MTATLRPPDCRNLVGLVQERERLSHTRLSVLLACPRKFSLRYEERLEPIRRKHALSLGSAFQKGVELQDPEAAILALKGWTLVDDSDLPEGKWVPPAEELRFYSQEDSDAHDVDCVIVRSAVELYMRRWPAPAGERREFEYVVRLRNPWTGAYSRTFDLHGYADGLEPWYPPGEIPLSAEAWTITENKLVGQVSPIKVKRLPLDRQLALERYAVWRVTGLPVVRVNYRWIKKPSIRRRAKESQADFLERLADDYREREDFYVHEENPEWITTEDLLRIEAELWEFAEMIRQHRRRGVPPRNTSHCTEYGGCDFLPICTGDRDAMSLYRVRPERTETLIEAAPEAEEA